MNELAQPVEARTRRDLAKTRQRILDAAARQFAEKGLAGARMDAIAEQAGVSKAMIYYIHGGKEELHLAVIRDLFEEKIAKIDARVADVDLSAADLLQLFDLYFDAFFARQDYVRIMIDDAVTGGNALRRLRRESPGLFAVFDTLARVFGNSMQSGSIREIDTDKSVMIVVFILSSLVCMLPHMDIIRPGGTAAYQQLRSTEGWKNYLRAMFERTIQPAG
jgi:AcrR family transcriptional regulator